MMGRHQVDTDGHMETFAVLLLSTFQFKSQPYNFTELCSPEIDHS